MDFSSNKGILVFLATIISLIVTIVLFHAGFKGIAITETFATFLLVVSIFIRD